MISLRSFSIALPIDFPLLLNHVWSISCRRIADCFNWILHSDDWWSISPPRQLLLTTISGVDSQSFIPDYTRCQVSHWIRVPLEKAETFLFWKAQMENLLYMHPWSIRVYWEWPQVIPDEKNADGSPNPQFKSWRQRDRIVLGWIQAAVGSPMSSLVLNHKLASDCWKTRELHLSPRKTIHSQNIWEHLREIKKSDSEFMGGIHYQGKGTDW